MDKFELDLASERRLYEAGIRPSAEIGLLLLSRLEQAEQAIERVWEVVNEAKMQEIHMQWISPKEILEVLDGDGRG